MLCATCMTMKKKSNKKKTPFEDDGRTIADMSGVERPSLFLFRFPSKKGKTEEKNNEETDDLSRPVMPKGQTKSYMLGTVMAALLIAGVFILAGAAVIALLIAIWAK